jgi:hypothetical protein
MAQSQDGVKEKTTGSEGRCKIEVGQSWRETRIRRKNLDISSLMES